MADTSVTGAKNLGSSGVLYTDRRDFYIRPNIVKELWTDVTPFLTVVANQGTISGMADPTFKMFEHRNPWQKQQFQAGADPASTASGAELGTAIAVDGFVGLEEGKNIIGLVCDVFADSGSDTPTGDTLGQVLITEYGDDGKIKFKVLSKSTIDAGDNAHFIVVGNAQGEGTTSPKAWSDDLSVVYNQCQIFKTPLEITGTLLEASLRGESKELARLRDQKSAEHKIQKERAFLFGSNPKGISGGTVAEMEGITDSAGNVVRTTMGIVSALKQYGDAVATSDAQNVFASTNVDTYGEFVDAMEKVFQYVPTAGVKRCFAGPGALGYWSKQGTNATDSWTKNDGWTANLGDMKRDALGFNYRMLETPHGVLQLIPCPAFRGQYNKHMLIVNEENMFHAQYRKPQFQASIQANDYDGVKDQYMSDEGIGISLLESHSLMVTP